MSTFGPALGGPVMPTRSALTPLTPGQVRITGGFWGDLQKLAAEEIIDHALGMMERHGWLANFDRAAAGTLTGKATGMWFVDSETYKILEAMAWTLGQHPNDELERKYHALVARVAAAQEPDGYLHTYFGRKGQQPRWSDMELGHELYCFGHLIQAAVARLRTGHDDQLVHVARRVADHVLTEFSGPQARSGICGHAEIEMALAELGRATGEQKYLDMARTFVERHGDQTLTPWQNGTRTYYQDDIRVRDTQVLAGHAVRALYLASGAADVALECDDAELASAVHTQWQNTVAARTYITGGMGSTQIGEAFGEDFQLPADTSYAETCAGVASVMLSWRMLLAHGGAEYAELIERTLLNNVLVSPAEDGRAFFYANTHHLRTAPEAQDDSDALHAGGGSGLRKSWFATSCCPTNIARTLASIHLYIATTRGDALQIHQYADAEFAVPLLGETLKVQMSTAYPQSDRIVLEVTEAPAAEVALELRIPAWAQGTEGLSLTLNGDSLPLRLTDGRAEVRRRFTPGDRLTLTLPREPRLVCPDPRIDAVRGTCAVERGPWVMALEDLDIEPAEGAPPHTGDTPPATVNEVSLDPAIAPSPVGEDSVRIGLQRLSAAPSWPYGQAGTTDPEPLTAVMRPYRTWARRGPTTMRIFLPRVTDTA